MCVYVRSSRIRDVTYRPLLSMIEISSTCGRLAGTMSGGSWIAFDVGNVFVVFVGENVDAIEWLGGEASME